MPFTVNTAAVSAVVKESTQTLHAEVENLLVPKLSSLANRADYAAILHAFYGYFLPLETILEQYITPDNLPDVFERRKAASLLHDLSVIGLPVTDIPVCHSLPSITNRSRAFGAMYVLEGSTLGGKMIARVLLKNSALSLSENAVSFFSGYKQDTGSKWKEFLEILNQQQDIDQIVDAANDTFYHLKCWLQHTLYNE